tara:strand:- start:3998 stop:4135 length:138 start_codon:yes stop_codon:yes gene_type:complete
MKMEISKMQWMMIVRFVAYGANANAQDAVQHASKKKTINAMHLSF